VNDPHASWGELESDDRDDLPDLARRLREACPVPAPTFVRRLRRAVIDIRRSNRESARARIAGWAVAGALLLILGAVGAAGAGPFGG
jgi:hypothetical protein